MAVRLLVEIGAHPTLAEMALLFDLQGTEHPGYGRQRRRPPNQVRVTDRYQTLRAVSDLHVFVVCRDGEFYETVPDHVRQRGPWQVQHRGELTNLAMAYLLDIEEQGYSLVRCELAVFKPEGLDSKKG